MFRTLEYYYWNMGYILYDYWDDFKRSYLSSHSYRYGTYSYYDDTLMNEISKLEDRIYELENEKKDKTDIVVILKDQKKARLKKLLRSQSI